MAISKILNIKDSGSSFHGKHLKAALEYIMVPEKTQNGRFVAGVNCFADSAFEQMQATKRNFNKTDKRQAYHIILSFKEGEASCDTIFELTERFVTEYLSDGYEAVFAVHDNTDHPHSHIIFNSVSFINGRKYHYKKGDWEKYIQPVTNRLCKEYGLSVIEFENGIKEHETNEDKEKRYTYARLTQADMIKRDVDACILQSSDYESFLVMLERKGYKVKNSHGEGKYVSVMLPGMKRVMRLKTLGDDYTEESIRRRIAEENISSYHHEKTYRPQIVSFRVKRCKRAKLSGIQKEYFARLYRIGKLKKKAYSEVWRYADEIRQMNRLQEEYKFLVKHGISTVGELVSVTDILTNKKKDILSEKNQAYRENKSFKELYDIAGKMKELEECEHSFLDGDNFFIYEHRDYQKLQSRLIDKGYSYEEVMSLKEHYNEKLLKCRNSESEILKELRIAENIKADLIKGGNMVTDKHRDVSGKQR